MRIMDEMNGLEVEASRSRDPSWSGQVQSDPAYDKSIQVLELECWKARPPVRWKVYDV